MFGRPKDPGKLHAKGRRDGLIATLAVHRRDLVRGGGATDVDVGWQRRAEAARLLAEHEGEETDAALVAAGQEDPSAMVRHAALTGLLARGGADDRRLVAIALGLEDEAVRLQAAESLATVAEDDGRVMELLRAYATLDDDDDATFDDAWVGTLGRRLGQSDRTALVREVAPALTDDRPRPWQVVHLDVHAAARVLAPALREPDRRTATLDALARLRSAAVVDDVAELVGSEDPAVRASAVAALGAIRHPTGVKPILRATLDDDARVRDAAMAAMDGFGVAGSVWGIVTMAGDVAAELGARPLPAALTPGTDTDTSVAPPQPRLPAPVPTPRRRRRWRR